MGNPSEPGPASRRSVRTTLLAGVGLCAIALVALRSTLACSRQEPTPSAGTVPAATAEPPPSQAPPAPPQPPPQPQPKPPYNVLLLIDALRADMPWTGYPRQIAPWLTKFSGRATLYPRGYALSSYTAKAVLPALAGLSRSSLPAARTGRAC